MFETSGKEAKEKNKLPNYDWKSAMNIQNSFYWIVIITGNIQ